MANSRCTAVDVELVEIDAELLGNGKALRDKGFVDFNNVHVIDGKAGAGKEGASGWNRAYAHDRRVAPSNTPAHNASKRSQVVLLNSSLIGKDQRG